MRGLSSSASIKHRLFDSQKLIGAHSGLSVGLVVQHHERPPADSQESFSAIEPRRR